MKRILFILLAFVPIVMFGQEEPAINVDDNSKDTSYFNDYYLKSEGFILEMTKKNPLDSLLGIGSGRITYGLAQDLNVTAQQLFDADTVIYWLPLTNSLALGTGTYTLNTLRAFIIYCPKDFIFDGYAVDVATGAGGGVLIMGIYSDTVISNKHYPNDLLYKTAVIDASGTAVIAQNAIPSPYIILKGGTLYWYAISTNNSSIAIRSGAVGSMPNILGWATGASGAAKVGFYVSRNYNGDLPDPFPDISGATSLHNAALPLLFLRQK